MDVELMALQRRKPVQDVECDFRPLHVSNIHT